MTRGPQHILCTWLPLPHYSLSGLWRLKENARFWLSIQTWQVKVLCFHGNRILTASNKGHYLAAKAHRIF